MQAVILAGGYGTRISEETGVRPKPMVEIGGRPILWHIMKIYSAHGIHDFVVCCGYRGDVIKDFFANYTLHSCDVAFDVAGHGMEILRNGAEPWRVTLVDTGEATMTGGRLLRIRDHLDGAPFCLTYGDGVGDVDVTALIEFHHGSGNLATLTAVRPPGRFGAFSLAGGETRVRDFAEKPDGDGDGSAWVNGGFFVVEHEALELVEGEGTVWEREPMARMAEAGRLGAFRHRGFWQPMDTLRDRMVLEELWRSGRAPWKVW